MQGDDKTAIRLVGLSEYFDCDSIVFWSYRSKSYPSEVRLLIHLFP